MDQPANDLQTYTLPRVYIAGPMTGYPDHNYPAFAEAAEKLRARGYEVKTPPEINDEIGYCANPDGTIPAEHYAACMKADIKYVTEWADEVAVLVGWSNSKGARLEVHLAQVLCKPVWSAYDGRVVTDKVITTFDEA